MSITTTAVGSGTNGPATAQNALSVSLTKDLFPSSSAAVGEIDPLQIFGRQSGAGSDMSGILINVQNTGTGFLSATEFASSIYNTGSNTITRQMDVQEGVLNAATGDYDGAVYTAQTGSLKYGVLVQSANGSTGWQYAFAALDPSNALNFTVDTAGNVHGIASGMTVTATGGSKATDLQTRFGLMLNLQTDATVDPTGVVDVSTALQTLLTQIGANGGGTLDVPFGTYLLNSSSILISSNTRIRCSPGTTFKLGSSQTSYGFINVNNTASSLTDHDIVMEDCGGDMSNFSSSGTKHMFEFHAAQRVHLIRPVCVGGGGDCVAILRSNDTWIQDGFAGTVAAPMNNACWDHWDADSHVLVDGGQCYSALYGVLVTGTNTAGSSAGVTDDAEIRGGSYYLTNIGSGVFFNGLGAAGSGVTHGRISHVYINAASTVNTFIKISGGGNDVIIDSPTLTGGAAGGIFTATDSGGVPTNTKIVGGIFDSANATGQAFVKLNGTGDSIDNATFVSGTYPYNIQLNGTNQSASGNHIITAGSSGAYLITAAQGNRVTDLAYIGSWTPVLKFGGATVGVTYSTQTGQYWLEGDLIRLCGNITLTSKGSSTGSASITGIPYASFNGDPTWNVFQIARTASITGVPNVQVLLQSNSSTLAIDSSVDSGQSAILDTAFSNTSVLKFCGVYSMP